MRSVHARSTLITGLLVAGMAASIAGRPAALAQSSAPAPSAAADASVVVSAADCTTTKLGTDIPSARIGEPVARVTLSAAWVADTANSPAFCRVDGAIAPVDTAPTSRPINFSVVLPASWNRRAVQLGGGGFNGTIPNLTGGGGPGSPSLVARGFVTYGSDSGHQAPTGGRRGAAAPDAAPAAPRNTADDWTLNDEAMANFGYMQLKKTHDAAMVLVERLYGSTPRFNYFIGTSQGGREALTVAQRYPADYNGIVANVPVVSLSTLMLAPELIRIKEKPAANWITPAKVNAIRGEFMRQCDALDGLTDGIINNYMACRAIFDVSQGKRGRHPWETKRCPNNVDPNPAETGNGACLTDGQIATLELTYSRYAFATPIAHGARTFGMWVPNTDPSGSGLIVNQRFRGQEGAADGAPMHSHLGVLGVTGFLMKNLAANPLDYVEGGPHNARRSEISGVLDSTNPDLSAFEKRGGRMIVTIGTNDTLASPGAQLDYYQAVLDKMGRRTVDRFARLFVMPQAGHGLSGNSYTTDGTGKTQTPVPIPNRFDQVALLFDWVEKNVAPSMSVVVTAGERTLPLCSYPSYPRYASGPVTSAASYRCAQ